MSYLLHVRYPNGSTKTLTFETAQARGLFLISLSAQPVAFRTEDRSVVEVALVPTSETHGIVDVALIPKGGD